MYTILCEWIYYVIFGSPFCRLCIVFALICLKNSYHKTLPSLYKLITITKAWVMLCKNLFFCKWLLIYFLFCSMAYFYFPHIKWVTFIQHLKIGALNTRTIEYVITCDLCFCLKQIICLVRCRWMQFSLLTENALMRVESKSSREVSKSTAWENEMKKKITKWREIFLIVSYHSFVNEEGLAIDHKLEIFWKGLTMFLSILLEKYIDAIKLIF